MASGSGDTGSAWDCHRPVSVPATAAAAASNPTISIPRGDCQRMAHILGDAAEQGLGKHSIQPDELLSECTDSLGGYRTPRRSQAF
jgi:hypothetical protein